MKVGSGGGERKGGPVGRKTCGSGGDFNEKDRHRLSFHLLIVSSCLIPPRNVITSALIKISSNVYEDVLNYPE